MKILYHHSCLSCFCPYLMPFLNKHAGVGICHHCLKFLTPYALSSFKLLFAKITQLPITDLFSVLSFVSSPSLDMNHLLIIHTIPSPCLLQQPFFLSCLLLFPIILLTLPDSDCCLDVGIPQSFTVGPLCFYTLTGWSHLLMSSLFIRSWKPLTLPLPFLCHQLLPIELLYIFQTV